MSLCSAGLCRAAVHGLLGLPDPKGRCRGIPAQPDDPGLRCVVGCLPASSPHVVGSAAIRPRASSSSPTSASSSLFSSPLPSSSSSPVPSPSASSSTFPMTSTLPSPSLLMDPQKEDHPPPMEWIDDGARGLNYRYGCGGRGRLELCTESLGFESCCDGRMSAEEERAEEEIRRRIHEAEHRQGGIGGVSRNRRPERGRTKAELPPPLTWMRDSDGGRYKTFLKAARRDGRFMLTEIWIERPEIFRASRRDGRLRLELVNPEAEAAVEKDEGASSEMASGAGGENSSTEPEAEVAEEEGKQNQDPEEEETRWRPPSSAMNRRREDGGEFRAGRCQEAAREALPSPPFWSTRFLTMA